MSPFRSVPTPEEAAHNVASTNGKDITLNDGSFRTEDGMPIPHRGRWAVIHEFGHVWDYNNLYSLSRSFALPTMGNAVSEYGSAVPGEDWAESWAYYIFMFGLPNKESSLIHMNSYGYLKASAQVRTPSQNRIRAVQRRILEFQAVHDSLQSPYLPAYGSFSYHP